MSILAGKPIWLENENKETLIPKTLASCVFDTSGEPISDKLGAGLYRTDVDEALNNASSNPVQNSAVSAAVSGLEARLLQSEGTVSGLAGRVAKNEATMANLINLIYPVGSIYMSTKNVSPATFLGGTWTQIQNRFLLAAGSSYAAGSTGGAATVALTAAQMPSHTHTFTGTAVNTGTQSANHTHSGTTSTTGNHNHTISKTLDYGQDWNPILQNNRFSCGSTRQYTWTQGMDCSTTGNHAHTMTTGANSANHTHSVTARGTNSSTGSGSAHDNMPPYLTVYMWQRTK